MTEPKARRQVPENPLISAIVPVRNGGPMLAEALQSIVLQTESDSGISGKAVEIIVVDDGSTDGSAELAERFTDVRVHRQAPSGLAAARNAGIELARGEFIAFLDADDVWLRAKLRKQLDMLHADPAADLCFTLVQHVRSASSVPLAETVPDESPRLGRLMQCLVARRRAFAVVGPFDGSTRTRGDQDWLLRAADAGLKEVVVPEVLTLRRIHGENHSLDVDSHVADDLLTIVKRTLDRRRDGGVRPTGQTWRPSDSEADS